MGRAHDTEDDGYRGESPPPVDAPAWQRRIFIDRRADLAALANDLATARILAIDAEFVNARVRGPSDPSHRLALLQIAADNDYRASYVVDALRLPDLSALEAPLADAAILKLFHGISADARVLATRDLYPRHTLDLEAVSRSIFGQRESGLQAMLQRACGVRLDKSLQRADWARRPLTPAMIAYAARDAEMTYALYGWLVAHHAWAIALHKEPADAPPLPVAPWVAAFVASPRSRPLDVLVAEAGLSRDQATQARDIRHAIGAVRQPHLRVRVMRLASDLELPDLAPELRPFLAARPAEERGGAARALGRLRDWESLAAIEALRDDPVQDVRQAAETALELLKGPPRPHRTTPRPERAGGARTWVVNGEEGEDGSMPAGDWRAALLRSFGAEADPSAQADVPAAAKTGDTPGDE
jgi:ribonuclease D